MAISTSDKIFIDPSEEIVSVIERILNSEKDRVILVIPQNSIILSSYISINILFREVSKTKKVLLIVTEDTYGKHISEKAGFIVAPKVSQITSEMWDASINSKNELIEKLSQRKIANLSNINELDSSEIPSGIAIDEDALIEPEVENVNILKDDESDNLEVETVNELISEGDSSSSSSSILGESHSDHQTVDTNANNLIKRYQKPRREPKIINIDGIEMLSGGDVRTFKEDRNRVKIEDMNEPKNDEDKTVEPTSENEPEIIERRPARIYSEKPTFTGLDLRKPKSSGGFLSNILNKRGVGRRSFDSDFSSRVNPKLDSRRILIILAILFSVLLAAAYFFFFRFSSVDITLTLVKEDVSTQASLSIDPTASIIDRATSTIPGRLIQENSITLSRTGEATGQSVRGNKAKGVIDILNSLDRDITLPVGTRVTSTETNLVYIITKEEVAKKATPEVEGGSVASATRLVDLPVEALEAGERYNITGSGSNTQFLIEGYTSTQLVGSRYRNITGGTSQEFVSVSQANIDSTKEVILPDLRRQAETKLNALIPAGYTILTQTIKFEEVESKASPALGEESSDRTFSLSVTGKISALAIKQEDLNEIARSILVNNRNSNSTINSLDDLQITDVQEVEEKTVLTISSKGSLTKSLDVSEMKSALAGLSIPDARSYLGLFGEIDRYRIVFAPDFTPVFLQRIPTDFDRINIRMQ